MPRQSAEERSAAAWREGGRHPDPPDTLSVGAKAIWREIVGARPVDFFSPGNLHLLEQYCVALNAARKVAEAVERQPVAAAKAYGLYMARCAAHATKLRLSIQSSEHRHSRKLDEREPQAKASQLLGAGVVRLDRSRQRKAG